MGPRGAGKTELRNPLIGLQEPDRGQVLINGMSPLSSSLHEKIRMAMVFQNSGLLNSLSVEENVSLYLSEHRLKPGEEIRQIVSEQLSHLNLNQADAAKYPYELSGGMKKRVAIARAIVMEPKVILYDEPTAELDPLMARTVVNEIRRACALLSQTSVLVTHDRDLAFEIADRIAILLDGSLSKIGTPDEIKACQTSTREEDAPLKNFLTANYKIKKIKSDYE
jgi:phospholipid/cholesterol/gamma-HCH transport system ATP-binding protein